MATNGNVNHYDQYAAAAQTTEAQANADNSANNLPKDEVGWYFVEQYYTTLSKQPERLHLFYGKKSQLVSGKEAEVVHVSVGRHAIQEHIRNMDFQDCKVRISNVDSQGSEQNIVIQVIGEISNKGGEPKKFVQTFVLAQQPSGYFVLNDILRYIDEGLEEEAAEAPAEESTAPAEVPSGVETEAKPEGAAAEETAVQEQEPAQLAAAVSQKLEEAAAEPPAAAQAPAAESAAEVQEPATTEEPQAQPDVEKAVEEIAEEEIKKQEEPQSPRPTPAAAPSPASTPAAAPAPAQPEKPQEPPKPMSWASRVAAAAGVPRQPVAPVVPKTSTPPAPAQPRAAVPAATQQAAPAAQQPETAPAPAPAAPKDQDSEWQTAETKRQSRAQPSSAAPAEKEGTMAYIKYVTPKVKDEDLRATLSSFGELAYFDINRQKNCAFVEFKTQAGYNAAVAANPHTVNGENIVVEQRRPKANAYGGSNYQASRQGPGGRGGRGGYEPTRSGSQSGRGGFTGQSRGRGGAPRGRGGYKTGTAE
ncbi:hypothetical protein VTK56DRAFT_3916 [Thermocarpiscus australiensis]